MLHSDKRIKPASLTYVHFTTNKWNNIIPVATFHTWFTISDHIITVIIIIILSTFYVMRHRSLHVL